MFKDNRSLINIRIAKFLSVIEDEAKPIYGFSSENIGRRLKQIILRDYNSTILTLFNEEVPYGEFKLCSKRVIKSLPNGSHQIKFSLKQSLIYLSSGLKVLLASTIFSFVGVFRNKKSEGSKKVFGLGFTLKDLIPDEDITAAFLRFCKEGPIGFLGDENKEYWIEDSVEHQAKEKFQFTTRNPILSCFMKSSLSFGEAFQICLKNLSLLGLGLTFFIRGDKRISLLRELSFIPILESFINKSEVSDILVTNSNYFDVYLWLAEPPNKSFKSHMLWYSGGLGWYNYQSNEFYLDSVENSLMEVGTHWVWTEKQKEWLKEKHSEKVNFEVVGPILFYLPKNEALRERKKIVLFDLTPIYKEQFILRYGTEVYYYNQFSTVLSFVEDILEVARKEGVIETHEILYKTKRRKPGYHVDEYFQKLSEFEGKGLLKVMDSRCDLWELVEGATMVFVLAPSSPVYLGQHFNIPSYYYDPLSVLKVEEEHTYNGASLIRGKQELEEVIHSLVNKGNINESDRANSHLF